MDPKEAGTEIDEVGWNVDHHRKIYFKLEKAPLIPNQTSALPLELTPGYITAIFNVDYENGLPASEMHQDGLQVMQLIIADWPPRMSFQQYYDTAGDEETGKCFGNWHFEVDKEGQLNGFVHASGHALAYGKVMVVQMRLVRIPSHMTTDIPLSMSAISALCGV